MSTQPTTLTQEALQEFRQIWEQKNPGKKISDQKLYDLASRVLRATQLIYRAIPKDKAYLLDQ